jgi:ribonuclease HI
MLGSHTFSAPSQVCICRALYFYLLRSHVDRELNSRADTLANRAMDQQFSSEESLVPNR